MRDCLKMVLFALLLVGSTRTAACQAQAAHITLGDKFASYKCNQSQIDRDIISRLYILEIY